MNDYLILLIGLLCAGGGGELFIKGAVGLATWARIPAGIVGATIAAFATSSPELSVSISSALAGTPGVALGDAIGSNVTNLGAVLGIALLISRTWAPRESLTRDLPVAMLVPVVLLLLAVDGTLSRVDGFVLLALFVVWFTASVLAALRSRAQDVESGDLPSARSGMAIVYGIAGLVLLVLAGRFIVEGAVGIATAYGMAPYVIGATVVALGTSVPELATTVIAKLRGHQEVALGTILGSNIFNGLLIVGVASTIHPIPVALTGVSAGLLTGLVLTALIVPSAGGLLKRRRGGLLVALYAVYIAMMLQMGSGH